MRVRSSQVFLDKLNNLLTSNSVIDPSDETWLSERFLNAFYYTYYSPEGKWNNKAWFRVCPDEARRAFNDSNNVSYNIIIRLHGVKNEPMTKEIYSFYHSRFVEYLLNNLLDEIKECAIATLAEDIQELDRFMNYDWR